MPDVGLGHTPTGRITRLLVLWLLCGIPHNSHSTSPIFALKTVLSMVGSWTRTVALLGMLQAAEIPQEDGRPSWAVGRPPLAPISGRIPVSRERLPAEEPAVFEMHRA